MSEPYAHVGVADVHDEERPGLTCADCKAYSAAKLDALDDNYRKHWAGLSFASVPGGASGARRGGETYAQRTRRFDKDMNTYREARRNGLRPEQTNVKAVEKAEKNEYARDRIDQAVRDGKITVEAKEA